jgi:N-acyl homoserine lactone hydrolase
MNKIAFATTAALSLVVAGSTIARAQTAPVITLSRLDCGTSAPPTDVGQRFSDTYAYNGLKVQLVFSCYLIRHGDDYLVWDSGQPATAGASAPKTSLVDLLAQANVKPEQVKFVGISHMHPDHTGQARLLPHATLLIGKGDWDVITDPKAAAAATTPFAPWLSGGGKFEAVVGDKDVFGDGTVMMLYTPGHTPGHHSLLVRLKDMGNVMLTGDLAHFHENYDSNGVPTFNTDRSQSLASLDRFKKLAANLKATVIIQHDARDIAKLPAFPAAAK